jgi:TolB protein
MLAAGHTGPRSAIPWSLVGTGWALAELSTAAPNSAGQASGGGTYTTYLVDPEGGRYKITASSGNAEPQLMAWSGNETTALFNTGGGTVPGTSSYQLLNVRTGQPAPLQLPTGVVAIGFTRPDGKAILAVRQGPAEFRLQRYTLTGQLEASLASLPRKAGETLPSASCTTACALSSPLGLTDVWGILGDGMQVLGNGGGKPHNVHVKGSGHPMSCMPLTWWNGTTILANCTAAGAPAMQQLWLVPADGSAPSALSTGVVATQGGISGAWLAGQTTYVTSATSRQCASAPSGPGGLDILPLGQGTNAAIMIPGTTHNFSTIVATQGKRLLVLTQTQCPGTSSLVWFDPSTGHSQTVISAPANEVGVIAAVPFGNGPTAVTSGY